MRSDRHRSAPPQHEHLAVDPRRGAERGAGDRRAELGIELPVSIDRRLEAGLGVGDHKTSMLQDLEAGKPLELDCMTGAVIEVAGKLGVSEITVKLHRGNVTRKMGARSLADLVRMAELLGLPQQKP